MHRGYMHRGYMHHGYMNHEYMNHGYMDRGYMHCGPQRPKGAKDEVKEARRAKRRPEGLKGGPKGHRLEVGARRAPKLLV